MIRYWIRLSAHTPNIRAQRFMSPGIRPGNIAGLALLLLVLASAAAQATTKGLNQIVTPDIQPVGVLSISAQAQNSAIANPEELQFELGLTKTFELAVFRGFSPGETIVNVELGIIQRKSFLLSAGVLGIEKGQQSQPFIEGGYYRGKGFLIAGIQRQSPSNIPIIGAGYQLTPRALVTVDYLGDAVNFATAGVTLTLTPALSFNPAIYVSNSSPHQAYGYAVLTWNIELWHIR